MDISYRDLLSNLGFERDPFATTNADEEELLEDYFIEPPFFKAVYGDIHVPKSAVVYAPRGGGKTALKRRIEIAAGMDAFLCVTYNTFPTTALKLRDIDLEYHLRNISRNLLIAVLSAATFTGIEKLKDADRHFLYLLSKDKLSALARSDLKEAISSVTNVSDKAKEAWNMLTAPLGAGLNLALAHFGFKAPELSKFSDSTAKLGSNSEQIVFLASIAPEFGFASTYVLIDKIDENVLTGKASSSLSFVKPLLSDLALLETPNLAFKFFLWDRLESEARTFSRPDRIKTYVLKWTSEQLKQMLSRRLSVHSSGRVNTLTSIVTLERVADIDDLVVTLSGGSPRNIIRICKSIFDQQSELNAEDHRISEKALLAGIEAIADELAGETVPENVLRDLKKLKQTDFTVSNVYADVFRISQQAGLQKVQSWQDSGAVVKIGNRQAKRGNRPSNLYAIANPLVLKHIFPDINALDFWERKVRFCDCGALVLRDWDSSQNQFCQACEAVILPKLHGKATITDNE